MLSGFWSDKTNCCSSGNFQTERKGQIAAGSELEAIHFTALEPNLLERGFYPFCQVEMAVFEGAIDQARQICTRKVAVSKHTGFIRSGPGWRSGKIDIQKRTVGKQPAHSYGFSRPQFGRRFLILEYLNR